MTAADASVVTSSASLLAHDEPAAYEVHNARGSGALVLTCDHASWRTPRALGDLGLHERDRSDHIGWDPGALDLALALSQRLDSPLVASGYSRLVVDCNRPLHVASAMPAVTCGVTVPGNAALTDEHKRARAEALHAPYHDAITGVLDARAASVPSRTALMAVHSFTPSMQGNARPWVAGMVYGRDRRLAGLLLEDLSREEPALVLGDNQPYQVTGTSDYTIPVHGEARGLPCVLLEVRNDQLRERDSVERWADRLARAWRSAERALFG